MSKTYITKNSGETQKLAKRLVDEINGPQNIQSGNESLVVCLVGDLGAGKTTFTQAMLYELGAKGPYTSPTFLVMKQYDLAINGSQTENIKFQNAYHIDAYRVAAKDILNLGWEEIVKSKNNVIIVEWADRIKKIIPSNAIWINFEWLGENERKIIFA